MLLLPKLTKPGYFCSPSIDEMKLMNEEQLKNIKKFSIFNEHARIDFMVPIDVTNLDLDKIVNINEKSVEIYPAIEFETSMPTPGKELNQPCQITFYHLVKGPLKDVENFKRKISAFAKTMNASLKDVNQQNGTVTISISKLK